MKLKSLWLALLGSALVAGVTPRLRAQPPSQQPSQQQSNQQKSGTFTGQIVKVQSGQLALLTDKQAGTGYFLDDQNRAKQFEGKTVKVIGTLDLASHTIHVSDIQPA